MGGKRFLHELSHKLSNVLANKMYFHRVTIAAQNEKYLKDVASWKNI